MQSSPADTAAETVSTGSEPVWYLAYSKPRQEAVAAQQLTTQGYIAYLPMCPPLRRPKYKAAASVPAAIEPMFPRYIFFRTGRHGQSLSPVRSTRGICNLVSFGVGPVAISSEVVAQVREIERFRSSADNQNVSWLAIGDHVRLSDDRLHELQGLVTAVAGERVTLLLNILGREKPLRVHQSQVELC